MITGIEWYEHQIEEKEKQLKRHKALAEIYKGTEYGKTFQQLVYDDEQYLIMLGYSLENSMWYRDGRMM